MILHSENGIMGLVRREGGREGGRGISQGTLYMHAGRYMGLVRREGGREGGTGVSILYTIKPFSLLSIPAMPLFPPPSSLPTKGPEPFEGEEDADLINAG